MASMIDKIKNLLTTKKKGKQTGSVFTQRLQKSSYRAGSLEVGMSKKRFWEQWKSGGKSKPQQAAIPGKEESKNVLYLLKLVVIFGSLLLGGYLLHTGPMHALYDDLRYFRIHEIELSGCQTIDCEKLRKFAGITYEMNMLSLEPRAVQNRLLKHPWVQSAKVKRIWPDGLAISVQEYRPQALLAEESGKQFSYVNSKGVVFAKVGVGKELDFPVITGIDSSASEETQKEMLKAANLFLRLAERNNPNLPAQNVSEIHFTETGELILYLVEHPFPIYLGKDEIKRKYSQLRRVLEVLYRKRKAGEDIDKVAYIRMDYQKNKVLVARNKKG
jgi:cell division protein FtsQ